MILLPPELRFALRTNDIARRVASQPGIDQLPPSQDQGAG